jgi:hypothetical protein
MKKTFVSLIAAASVLGLAGSAYAAMEGGPGMGGHRGMMAAGPMTLADVEKSVKDRFALLDTNKDGVVEKTEADAARDKMQDDRRDAHFNTMDANGDGSISRAEFDAGHEKRAEDRKAGKGHAMHGRGEGGGEGRGKGRGGHGRGGMNGGGMFANADANSDGKVTLSEALAKPTAHFKTMDANKDGTVTPEERQVAREKIRAERKAKRDI